MWHPRAHPDLARVFLPHPPPTPPAVCVQPSTNYPEGGKEACNLPRYLDPAPLRHMGTDVAQLAAAKAASGNHAILTVLEETGGSYGGGCENITDRFASGFWYLNAKGQTATNGMDRLHRQDVAGWSFTGGMSHYQLAGPAGWVSGAAALMPHPDWFTSVLHKQLTSAGVLAAALAAPAAAANVSVYAWCGSSGAEGLGGVTLVFTNPSAGDVALDLSPSGVPAAPRVEFLLTSSAQQYAAFRERGSAAAGGGAPAAGGPPASLQDDAIFLNGAPLTVDPTTALLAAYPIPGAPVSDPAQPLLLPAYSYGFVVLNGGSAAAPAVCA